MQVRKQLQNYFINNEEASGNISGAFFGLIENSKHIDNTCYSKRLGEHNVTDLLYVDLTNPNSEVNKTVYFGSENPGTGLINSPFTETAFYGYREVRWNGNPGNKTHLITVELHEQYPLAGRIWANTYNKDMSNWMGWKCLEPQRKLIVKEFSSGNMAITPTMTYKLQYTVPEGYEYVAFLGAESYNVPTSISYQGNTGNAISLYVNCFGNGGNGSINGRILFQQK
ncbi:hypothetical protein DXC26_00750 [Clostridiaceae bacterium OM08-6BH]|nr:hypothetical protein DXC26_00750 [Clostridiaceae bacterium OM08-6BH]